MLKYYAVFGHPIGHSLSPLIHNALITYYDLPGHYLPIDLAKADIGKFPELWQNFNLSGANVTMPHKQSVISHLDTLDEAAQLYQTVNTINQKDGKLVGHCTDGLGFCRSLAEKQISLQDQNVLILGTGGVAQTLALTVAQEKASGIAIAGRNTERAASISAKVQQNFGLEPTLFGLEPSDLKTAAKKTDLVINATPLGMAGYPEDFPEFSWLTALPEWALIYDLIYHPAQTDLLKNADVLGFKTLNGWAMLVWQAFYAFKIFWGIMPGVAEKEYVEGILIQMGVLSLI